MKTYATGEAKYDVSSRLAMVMICRTALVCAGASDRPAAGFIVSASVLIGLVPCWWLACPEG